MLTSEVKHEKENLKTFSHNLLDIQAYLCYVGLLNRKSEKKIQREVSKILETDPRIWFETYNGWKCIKVDKGSWTVNLWRRNVHNTRYLYFFCPNHNDYGNLSALFQLPLLLPDDGDNYKLNLL